MTGLNIEDRKIFTQELFVGRLFDRFQVREASFVTFSTFTVDGRTRQGYYTEQEKEDEEIGEYVRWDRLKPFCFFLMKGKKLPESFHIVFQLPPAGVERFLRDNGLGFRPEQVRGLYLNVSYEDGAIRCVTGTSVDFFTMDKSLERAWDQAAADYLRRGKIPFTQE